MTPTQTNAGFQRLIARVSLATLSMIMLTAHSNAIAGQQPNEPHRNQPAPNCQKPTVGAVYIIDNKGACVTRLWTKEGFNSGPETASSDGVSLTDFDNTLYRFSSQGKLRWTHRLEGLPQFRPIIDASGTIYVPYSDSLNGVRTTSDRSWRYKTREGIRTPIVTDPKGNIYFAEGERLTALTHDGRKRWTTKPLGSVSRRPAIGRDGTIYVATRESPGQLHAIKPSGEYKWGKTFDDSVFTSPVAGPDNRVYVPASDQLYAISAQGNREWVISLPGKVLAAPAVGPNGTIYVIASDQHLYAITPQGQKRWRFEIGVNAGTPAIASDGTIYVSAPTRLIALSANGKPQWRFSTGSYILSSPTVGASGAIYVKITRHHEESE